jgi:integrase
MIDDRMFQRRTFKPVLQALGIQDRDLYSCRHTFATRAVQSGMKAHEVAYLMGDNLQTVIANYYHKERVSVPLPAFF